MAKRNKKQLSLLDLSGEDNQNKDAFNTEWENEWKGMPEYVCNDLKPAKTLLVHFENAEDLKKFAKLTGQKITWKTSSIWFPQATLDKVTKVRWVDQDTQDLIKLDLEEADEEENDSDEI